MVGQYDGAVWDAIAKRREETEATDRRVTALWEDQDRALKLALVRIERLERQIGALDVDTDRRLRALENGR